MSLLVSHDLRVPSAVMEKEMATHSSIPAWKIPIDRGAWSGYSPWDCKESDTTKRLHFSFFLYFSGGLIAPEGLPSSPLQGSAWSKAQHRGPWPLFSSCSRNWSFFPPNCHLQKALKRMLFPLPARIFMRGTQPLHGFECCGAGCGWMIPGRPPILAQTFLMEYQPRCCRNTHRLTTYQEVKDSDTKSPWESWLCSEPEVLCGVIFTGMKGELGWR